MSEISMSISGDKEILRMFEELPAAAQNRVVKPLMSEGAAILAIAERSEAPIASRLLMTSIGVSSLKTYGGGKALFITTGVRRGFRRSVQKTRRGGLKFLSAKRSADNPNLFIQNPAKYLHLVTGGRKAVSATKRKVLHDPRMDKFLGQSVAEAKANPFVTRAFDRAKGEVVSTITSKATDRILAEAKALLSR